MVEKWYRGKGEIPVKGKQSGTVVACAEQEGRAGFG